MDMAHPARLPFDIADLAWQARHRTWLATPAGRQHTAWHARPWPEISAEIGEEHRAEMLGKFPGATRGRGVIPDFHDD